MSHKKLHKKLILAEIVVILASVLVFRGLWLLLDSFSFMHTALTLSLSVVLGVLAIIYAFHYILKQHH